MGIGMISEDYLKRYAKDFPDRLAVIDRDLRLTFRDFYKRTNQFANALLKLGVKKEDRVAIIEKNSHVYMEALYGANKMGAALVTVNYRLKPQELSFILNNSEARTLIFSEEFAEVINETRPELKHVKDYIMIEKAAEGALHYEALLADSSDIAPDIQITESDIMLHMYTSGTTGVPKGVLLSHEGVMGSMLGNALNCRHSYNEVILSCGVFFHMPITSVTRWIMYGGTSVIMRDFDPKLLLQLVQSEKVTRLLAIPSMLNFILDEYDRGSYDVSSITDIEYGGMPISPALLERTMKVFKANFYQQFGSTEAGNTCGLAPEDHANPKLLASCGRPDVLTNLKIVDENNNELPANQPGEIAVRSTSVAVGYWKLPELNQKFLVDGWFNVGDIGYLNEQGYLFIVDRKSDMIISGGENIYPAEIDSILRDHPSVQQAAVIGVPDAEWGEAIKAVIVLKEGMKASEDEIISYCKERLAGYKKPKSVDFVDSLPISPAGKILKSKLREKYWQGHDRRVN